MNDVTKSIIETMGGSCPDECPYEVGCSGCECKCTLVAERIYTTHVKPLEDALAKSEADKTVLVEALEVAADYIGDESCGSSEFWDKYRAALAHTKENS